MPLYAVPEGEYVTVPSGVRITSSAEAETLGIPHHYRFLRSITHHYTNASVVEIELGDDRFYRLISTDGGHSFQPLLVEPPYHHLFTTPPAFPFQDFDDDDDPDDPSLILDRPIALAPRNSLDFPFAVSTSHRFRRPWVWIDDVPVVRMDKVDCRIPGWTRWPLEIPVYDYLASAA